LLTASFLMEHPPTKAAKASNNTNELSLDSFHGFENRALVRKFNSSLLLFPAEYELSLVTGPER
jgi:hypothetical protein